MSVHDRPAKIGVVEGDGNCLFRALAFYFSGTDIEHRRVRETVSLLLFLKDALLLLHLFLLKSRFYSSDLFQALLISIGNIGDAFLHLGKG